MAFSRLVREPLVHFLILGLLLFALFAWVNRGAMYAPDEIVINDSLLISIQTQFQNTWQREATPEELAGLVNDWTREEILFREGVALGLDQNDTVIRRRVVQKMEFITESMADTTPDVVELQAWLDAHPEKYQIPPEYSFRQIYFEPSRHPDDLRQLLDTAYAKLQVGDALVNGDSSLLPASMDDAGEAEVMRVFGREFAQGIAKLPVREWSEPLNSGFGVHFVYLESKQSARMASLAEVRQAVENDFSHDQTVRAREVMFEALAGRYSIIFETPPQSPDSTAPIAEPSPASQ